jgi:hypothetical protein
MPAGIRPRGGDPGLHHVELCVLVDPEEQVAVAKFTDREEGSSDLCAPFGEAVLLVLRVESCFTFA